MSHLYHAQSHFIAMACGWPRESTMVNISHVNHRGAGGYGMRRYAIGIVGDSDMGGKGSEKWDISVSLGRHLVDEGYRIISGGHGDLARALAEGARGSKQYRDGDLIAILPGFDPSVADGYSDITIATGFDHARNLIIANSDAVVAIGGGAGTLSEIAFAWSLKRLVMAYRNLDGWSGRLAGTRIDPRRRYPDVPGDQVYPIDTAEDVVRCLRELLPRYNQRHPGIVIPKDERQRSS
jgi:uncharacterized protein (TIGR00725 family)